MVSFFRTQLALGSELRPSEHPPYPPGKAPVVEMMASGQLVSAAQRRRGRRRGNEQQWIAMALATALQHSAGPWKKKVEMQQNAALRRQNTCTRAREEEENEKHDAPKVEAPLPTLPQSVPIDKEDEEELYSQRALQHRLLGKTSSNVRFLLRDEKTMRTVGNFFTVSVPYCKLEQTAGSGQIWEWETKVAFTRAKVREKF